MRMHLKDRQVTFRHEDGDLLRIVTSGTGASTDGRTYTHRCSLAAYEAVCHAIEETPATGEGATLNALVAVLRLPHTQVDVTLAFLQERGLIERRHRRNYPGTQSVYLDAMIEWHALAHAATGD